MTHKKIYSHHPKCPGDHEISHGANIADVAIIENSLELLGAALDENQALEIIQRSFDAKLLNFLTIANFGKKLADEKQYNFFYEENGEVKEVIETLFRVSAEEMVQADPNYTEETKSPAR